jgi:phospholipid/cholesterol/gamma-HCH transport system permease protein
MAESEILRHLRWMVQRGFKPTLLMAFFYGLLAAYFPASYLDNPNLFREWILPHFGGFFVSFLVPFAVANLFCVRGVVAIAADLSGMRVSQEIDILDTLGVDVARQLFAPRALALVLLAPVLAILGVGFGALGCWLGTSIFLPVGFFEFWREFMGSVTPKLYLVTIAKAAVIAFVLAIIAGAHAFAPIAPGSRDIVGRLTTTAVGVASLGVTILNLLFRMATS